MSGVDVIQMPDGSLRVPVGKIIDGIRVDGYEIVRPGSPEHARWTLWLARNG